MNENERVYIVDDDEAVRDSIATQKNAEQLSVAAAAGKADLTEVITATAPRCRPRFTAIRNGTPRVR